MKKTKILLGVATVLMGLTLATNMVSAKEVKEKDNIFYIVESGDSLSKIADKYDVDFTIVHGNNEKEIKHADMIFKGQKLLVGGKDFDDKKVKEYSVPQNTVVSSTQSEVQPTENTQVAQSTPQVASQETQVAVTGGDGSPQYAAQRMAEATGTSVDTWLYIIQAESSNNPTITNSIGCYGYFQIHPVHGMPAGASVDTQIQYAIQIYNSQGFGAWEVM